MERVSQKRNKHYMIKNQKCSMALSETDNVKFMLYVCSESELSGHGGYWFSQVLRTDEFIICFFANLITNS